MKKTLFSLIACLLIGTASSQVQVLADTSLEASAVSTTGIWKSTSSTYGTTWCSIDLCGNGGGSMTPRSGYYYSWFGGTDNEETGTLTQTFNVTTDGDAELKFWWKIPFRNETDVFKVLIDGVDKYTMPSNAITFSDYQELTIALGNLSAGTHTIQFYSNKMSGHPHNIALDDITLTVTGSLSTQNIGLSSGISIYHNSADQTLNISNKTPEKNAEIAIYEASGKLISSKSYPISNPVVITTAGWKSGMYLVNIKTAMGTTSKKVIVK